MPAKGAPARRVFLSHTAELREFPKERSFVAAAEAAVARAGYAATDMAYFTARDSRPADYSVRKLGEADVYVGIIGLRYGSPVRDRPDLSYVELEFDTATGLGLPRLIFLLDERATLPIPAGFLIDREHGERQDGFRRRLRRAVGLTSVAIASPAELELGLVAALMDLRADDEPQVVEARPSALFMAPDLAAEAVERREPMARLVDLLSREDGGRTIGLTTALEGAGGFGKTTLAALACHRLRDWFPGGVVWVTLGQHVAGAELVATVNDLASQLSGARPTFTQLEQAGQHLGHVLGDQRRLLVIDDVWRADQLTPFLFGGRGCTRLVTTRIHSVLPADAMALEVDAMNGAEARALLTQGLGHDLPDLRGILRRTGGWPVLLRLVNGAIRQLLKHGAPLSAAVASVERSLDERGPGGLDRPHTTELDVADPRARALAVSTTVEASLAVLRQTGPDRVERYVELAVFPEDVDVPQTTLQVLWALAGGLSGAAVGRLCLDLADLSLVLRYELVPYPRLRLHDVLVGFLAERAAHRLPGLHRMLLDGHRSALLAADVQSGLPTAWWTMSHEEPYLWNHLVLHMEQAGRDGGPEAAELEALAADLRWVTAKLQLRGTAAIDADLARATGETAIGLRRAIVQSAHLLGVLEPAHALAATLLTRVQHLSEVTPAVRSFTAVFPHRRLAPVWPLPDLPHPAALRVLAGHTACVNALAVAPDGSWLASAGDDLVVRLWNVAEGTPGVVLAGHSGPVRALAVAPDGSWLASAGEDGTVRLWSTADGTPRSALAGHAGFVTALAIAPDGSWLASASHDRTVRIWDVARLSQRSIIPGHSAWSWALAAAPDGSWLASPDDDHAVRLWDVTEERLRVVLRGHRSWVAALAAAPDGSWVASASHDGTVKLWSTADGAVLATLTGHAKPVQLLAVSPDGSWLASADDDRVVRIWNVPDGSPRAVLAPHSSWVMTLAAAPDGTWLATGCDDHAVRLWNSSDGSPRGALTGHSSHVTALGVAADGSWLASADNDQTVRTWSVADAPASTPPVGRTGWVRAVAVSPDGTWLATASHDRIIRLWSAADGAPLREITGHASWVSGLAVSPDGSWLASASHDWTVRLWNVADGSPRVTLAGHGAWVRAVAISPDGSWLASGGDDHTVRLWSTEDGSERGVLSDHSSWVTTLAISPDGRWLAVPEDDHTVRLWNAADGSVRVALVGHTDWVRALAFSPDGRWLASAGYDHTVRLWDVADGTQLAVLAGHTDSVRSLSVSADGVWLASAGFDRTVRIWDLAAGICATAVRVDGRLVSCAWLPVPAMRLAACGDGGLYLFDLLPPEHAMT